MLELDKVDNYWTKYNEDTKFSEEDIIAFKNKFFLDNKKYTILYFTHMGIEDSEETLPGGTQLHIKSLVENLKDEYNIIVTSRCQDRLKLSLYRDNNIYYFSFFIGSQEEVPGFRNKQLAKVIEYILDLFCVHLVHVQHVFSLSLDIYYTSLARNIPIFTTIHDYYFMCPSINMYHESNGFCNGQAYQGLSCKECLMKNKNYNVSDDFIINWIKENQKVLMLNQKIFVPTQSTYDILLYFFPMLQEKLVIISHGNIQSTKEIIKPENIIETHMMHSHFDEVDNELHTVSGWTYLDGVDSKQSSTWMEICDSQNQTHYFQTICVTREDVVSVFYENYYYLYSGFVLHIDRSLIADGKFSLRPIIQSKGQFYTDKNYVRCETSKSTQKENWNIAFLGAMTIHKGSDLIYEMIVQSELPVTWYLIGVILDPKLENLEQENVKKLGIYRHETLADLLQGINIDLICILSQVSETFCYTLSEAWSNKIPVLATDIGALSERINQNGCGWLVPFKCNSNDVLERIKDILTNDKEYAKVCQKLENFQLTTPTDMSNRYQKIYNQYIGNDRLISQLTTSDWTYLLRAYLHANTSQIRNPERVIENMYKKIYDNEQKIYDDEQKIKKLKQELDCIQNSRSYKLVRKVKRIFTCQ